MFGSLSISFILPVAFTDKIPQSGVKTEPPIAPTSSAIYEHKFSKTFC
jgi:hypothetical protein